MYLWAIALGVGVIVIVLSTQLRSPSPDYVQVGMVLAQLPLCIWATWWLLRGKPLVVAERVVFAVNALITLFQLLLTLTNDSAQVVWLASSAYWLLTTLAILAFLIFENRQALLFSAGMYLLGVLAPWAALLWKGQAFSSFANLLRVQLSCGVVLVLLSVLAWYRERFAAERGERLSMEQLANTDMLTGLPNRRALYSEIEWLISEARTGVGGCLILLDIDHFKRINDAFGHNVGDEVLIRLSELLRTHLKDEGTVGRWGGEEFLITLPGLSPELVEQLAEQLRRKLEEQIFSHGQGVTASFGLTCCAAGDDLQSCTTRADRALYAAKKAGRNRVVSLPSDAALDEDMQAPPVLDTLPVRS
ncbi:hypothetical protein GCM10022631_19230 [Deinococcus rubellus]